MYLRSYRRGLKRGVESVFGFGGRGVGDGLEQPAVVESLDPFQGRIFDRLQAAPRPGGAE